jgi:hypothetical protein
MASLYARIAPFLLLGVGIVAFIFGMIILAYLLFFGAMLGLVLFAAVWIRQKFFASKEISVPTRRRGRTIDHDE